MASLHQMNIAPRAEKIVMDSHGCWHSGNGYATYQLNGMEVERRCACRYVGPDTGEQLSRTEYYAPAPK